MRKDSPLILPEDLPIPGDDGACDHLRAAMLPSIRLPSTSGAAVDLFAQGSPWLVVYCYPRTGLPGQPPLGGEAAWNAIPGARGCTPQSCAYRDHHRELAALGATVYGLSTQDTSYQQEAVDRLHLPFALLSDAGLHFSRALGLPTWPCEGQLLIRRLTLIARAGRIEKVFYPVFPPDADAARVQAWLAARAGSSEDIGTRHPIPTQELS